MIKNDFIAKLAGGWRWYRWHPSIALRYLPFVDTIRTSGEHTTILEVGSAGIGIAPYIRRQVTGVDIIFEPPFHPLLKQIKGSALDIPFDNNSFDVVLSVDMFEHLKGHDRKKAIHEMMRVAKKKVLIGVPCGKQAHEQDEELDQYYVKHYGKRFHFFEEQVEFGLPEKEDIIEQIREAAQKEKKNIVLKVEGNENLKMHEWLMKGWMSPNLLTSIFFRKILLVAIPLLRRFNQTPTYRQLFYVDIIS
jgi:hypothetical protein